MLPATSRSTSIRRWRPRRTRSPPSSLSHPIPGPIRKTPCRPVDYSNRERCMKLRNALAATLLALIVAAPAAAQTPPTLYKRLGGYDAITAVSDDFLGRLSTNPQFSRFFSGHSTDSLKRLRQHVIEFLCFGT